MSDQAIRYEVNQGVAVITIDNPPVNAISPSMRAGVIDGVRRANEDTSVSALVLIGAGKNFIAGADIRQFGQARAVSTRDSARVIEDSGKPVIAAIDGYALGGGFEHALACHYRLATQRAKFGFPEVNIGLVPGGGGTQRLPRLIGPEAAIELIVSARNIDAQQALELELIDKIVAVEELLSVAIDYALQASRNMPLRRTRELSNKVDDSPQMIERIEEIRASVLKKARQRLAPEQVVKCVQAAVTLPFDEGIRIEKESFTELETSDQSKALRYAFFAEREATKIPGALQKPTTQSIEKAAVIGAGTMGAGIAMAYADAGIPVYILDASADGLARGMARIKDTYAVSVKRGSLEMIDMQERLARIYPTEDYKMLADADVAIEAVFERMDVKHRVFKDLDAVMKPDALLLTNSSALDIDAIGSVTRRPESVAGSHFFAPANVMKLCEVVRGQHTSMDTLLRTMQMGKKMGKVCAVAGSCDGFVANRSRTASMTELMLMLEEGARPEQIDRVMMAFGYPKGPFVVNDMSGLDVSYAGRQRRAAENPNYRKLHIPDRLVEMGRLGQKTGAGWYRYDDGSRKPISDDTVDQLCLQVAAEFDIPQHTFTDEEILHRLLFNSVNEACKILEEGMAYRASDIDVMWVNGFGFPRHRGGLMYWADSIGASQIFQSVSHWHDIHGDRWRPSSLLRDSAHSGALLHKLTGSMVADRA